MAKFNINFNNADYSIDESALADATSSLEQHLSSTMSGSGATINLGGTAYNIDSSKLATATSDFVSHLGKIAGNGAEIVINGAKYSVDYTKLSGALSELGTAFDNLSGGSTPDEPTEERLEGDGAEYYTLAPTALSFRSTAPLNELQEVQINGVTVDPANYTLEEGSTIVTFPIEYLKTLNVGSYEVAVASDSKTVKGDFVVVAPELNEHGFYFNQPYIAFVPYYSSQCTFFIREDGTYDFINLNTSYIETGTYEMNGNNIMTHGTLGDVPATLVSSEEILCDALGASFVLANDTSIAADEDYIYIYKEDLGGYEVTAIDKTKAEYGAIKTGINGIDTVKLANKAFWSCENLVVIPKMPDSVTGIGEHTFSSCNNLNDITIPVHITSIGSKAFWYCGFGNELISSIKFEGTTVQWSNLSLSADWNKIYEVVGDASADHYIEEVICSDGQVSLV